MTEPTYVREYNAIAEVLNKYLEGNAKGTSAATRLAFHEKATIFGVNGNGVFGPEIQKLYDIVDTLEPSANARTAIARIDVAATAANARVDSENVAGLRFTDFFNLVKIDGTWIIVNKVYHTYQGA
jgi:hypothetical protein